MNILVISDLHIDPGDNFGTFQWKEEELILKIEEIRNRYSVRKVIFNGDTYELLKYSMDEIGVANPLLMKYFEDRDFIFLNGNHDIMNVKGLPFYRIVNSSGQTIHIEHGHNADWFNGSKIGRFTSRLGLNILKKFSQVKWMMDLYFRIVVWVDQIYYIPKKYNTIKYLSYALRLLKNSDVVILAHTHKLESHHTYYQNSKKRYINCGTCSLGRFQGIVINSETLRYELIKETASHDDVKINEEVLNCTSVLQV